MSIQQTKPQAGKAEKGNTWIWPVLAAATGAAISIAAMPAVLPSVANAFSGETTHAYWYISRASAFVAFGLLWLSMLAGLGITSKLGRYWPGMPASYELHKFTALLGLGFGLVHALVLLGDKYMSYTIGQLLVPFMGSNYRPEWVGFGQLSFYALTVVALSFYVRDRLGVRAWRLIHMLSFALFLMTLIHGVQSGTDTSSWWATRLYAVSAASVLFGSVYRVVAVRAGRHKQTLAASGLVATPGKAQERTPRYANTYDRQILRPMPVRVTPELQRDFREETRIA